MVVGNDLKHDLFVNRNISTESTTGDSEGKYFALFQVFLYLFDLLLKKTCN